MTAEVGAVLQRCLRRMECAAEVIVLSQPRGEAATEAKAIERTDRGSRHGISAMVYWQT
jgi:hypothetical protein